MLRSHGDLRVEHRCMDIHGAQHALQTWVGKVAALTASDTEQVLSNHQWIQ
ncbi:hypothetical protein O9992_29545 [Vibrio lentus]|nr:hypothetical protein [Vibrio lentus]